MTDVVIRLDRSKSFSECRGERQTDDPEYRVAFWQGQLVGKDMILLPFDAQGELVPDDGKTEPWQGKDADGKIITHHPLYDAARRDLLERKRKRQTISAASALEDGEDALERETPDDVNLESYLRGEARYPWGLIQAAVRKRFSKVVTTKAQLVEDLVMDERIIPEAALAPELAKLLPAKSAA